MASRVSLKRLAILGAAGLVLAAIAAWLLLPVGPRAAAAWLTTPRLQRDAATEAAIAATRGVTLPKHRDVPLQLVVEKSRARLDVVAGGRVLRTLPIALGLAPSGRKEVEGDARTPEGRYVLVPHHESPSFGPCFFVTYPNEDDVQRGLDAGSLSRVDAWRIQSALQSGRIPPQDTPMGGLILLHATKDRGRALTTRHWTLGCVALEHDDLDALLAAFAPSDRPVIDIRP